MEKYLQIMHLADTHVLKSPKGPFLEGRYSEDKKPMEEFERIIKELLERHPSTDVVVITGDLVHEGTYEDYEELKRIIDKTIDIPVFLTLGNHDRKDGYHKIFKENNEKIYYYDKIFKGLRLIVLDSTVEGTADGEIDDIQMEWLENTLKTPTEKGNIILLHHPIVGDSFGDMKEHCLKNSDKLLNVLKNTNTRGILSGHTHKASTTIVENIPSIVAGSTAYGFNMDEEYMYLNNDAGYNIINISNDDLTVFPYSTLPKMIYSKISIEELMAML